MAEYIDREAAYYAFYTDDTLSGYEKAYCREIIKNVPESDVAPVVRCKECKFWDFGDCYRLELSRPDDFCIYVERKAE